MGRVYFFLITLTALLNPGISVSAETGKDITFPNPYITDYPFKSAIIRYTSETDSGYHGENKKINEGMEIVYIKGDKLARVTEMSVSIPEGNTKKLKRLTILTPDHVYRIDLVDKEGIKIDNSRKYGRAAYDELTTEEKKAFHQRMDRREIISLDLLGLGKKIGTDTILGRKCDVYESGEKMTQKELMNALQSGETPLYKKSWIWREAKIPLKVITESLGSYKELVATKIEENVEIADVKFEVPSDIRVTYDEYKSEGSRKATLARFNLYKTGEPMVIRMKAKKEKIPTKASSVSNENSQDTLSKKNDEADNSANSYTERILNYLSNAF